MKNSLKPLGCLFNVLSLLETGCVLLVLFLRLRLILEATSILQSTSVRLGGRYNSRGAYNEVTSTFGGIN